MTGSMMTQALTVPSLLDHANRYHGTTEVVSVATGGGIERHTWHDIWVNARKLSNALRKMGLAPGSRISTIAWNNHRHLSIYFGVAGAGMVCHTINPRLFPDQLTYIINHAEDAVLFVDETFLPLVAKIRNSLTSVTHVVVMSSSAPDETYELDVVLFDDLLKHTSEHDGWAEIDENQPSSLCYTSGTTGHPKGVLYSHRSTVLHTLGGNQPDGLAISAQDCVLPAVPMFHVNAWGVPYVAAATGCKLVLPGPGLDGASLVHLIDDEKVTLALGVPTIWQGLLSALESLGSKATSLQRTIVGGSALPPSMIQTFRDEYNVQLVHAWGMTETSPLGTVNNLLQKHSQLDDDAQALLRLGQGRPPFGVELRLVDEKGFELPNDGKTHGQLQIRGHWIVDTYFQADDSALSPGGWFDTGDIATLDEDGYLVIRDRAKDIIKSGGEWISTVELENIAIGHPNIKTAAVIAARHSKWDERPIVLAVIKEGCELDESSLLQFYEGKVASWQIPDRVIFVDVIPIGGTGKVLKNRLREEYAGVLEAGMKAADAKAIKDFDSGQGNVAKMASIPPSQSAAKTSTKTVTKAESEKTVTSVAEDESEQTVANTVKNKKKNKEAPA